MTAPAISTLERDATLGRLERERFDCVVIGGGITGAGIAREAARRGASVALLEAVDFASGTSSRSSKLIHGGLRYLAMGDVALVRSTALERKVIHAMAPHLAEPRWLVIPAKSRASLLTLRAAVTTYEKLGAVERADRHHNWSRTDLDEREPLLRSDRFSHAVVYREYLSDDVRLVLANLRDAVGAGALVLNYAKVTRITAEHGAADGVEARCALSGQRFRVRAGCVINAAGPWVDPVRALEDPAATPRLLLSKGIHVVLPAARLPVAHMLILPTTDKRSVFVIRRGAVVYIGTTDTVYERGVETWPEISREDVAYLLQAANRNLCIDPLRADEITAAWAGLRPLIGEPGKAPSEISRKDEVWIGPERVVSIAGGKLTGYRPMAQLALSQAQQATGLALAPSTGDVSPLPGGDFPGELQDLAGRVATETGLDRQCALRLASLYGAEAPAVARRGPAPLVAEGLVLAGEVDFALEVDGAATLEDVLYRRTRVALYAPEECDALVAPLSHRLAERLGWSEEERAAQCKDVREQRAHDLAFQSQSQSQTGNAEAEAS